MMSSVNKCALVLAVVLTVFGATRGAAALAQPGHDSTMRIAELCLARQPDDEACHCLSRETGSRFEADQLEIIVDAMEAGQNASDIRAALLREGLSEAEVTSFAHRLDTAHVVIQQTCSASFFVQDAD